MAAGQIQLHICGLIIGALRGARREWIAPEILDVLHMFLVVFQLTYQAVIVCVCGIAEWMVALQDDHRQNAGFSFLEVVIHVRKRLDRRRIIETQRY